MTRKQHTCWAILWRTKYVTWLIGEANGTTRTMLFTSRKDARKYVNDHYGYIGKRLDLQHEPYNWRMPKPVRVDICVTTQERRYRRDAVKEQPHDNRPRRTACESFSCYACGS
jgi:hypothetical protein